MHSTRHALNPTKFKPDARTLMHSTSKHKKPKFEGVLTDEFEAQLDDYASKLLANFHSDVDSAKRNAKDTLDGFLAHFHNSYKILEDAEKDLWLRFADEQLELAGLNDEDKPVRTTIDSRIKGYREQLKAQTLQLDSLWEEWSFIQRDLACLAIEVFGPDAVTRDIESSDDLEEMVRKAQSAYEQRQRQDSIASEKLSQMQSDIESFSEKSISESKQHLKDIRIERRKQAEAINMAVRSYGSV